jgi:hypothetical protein
MQGPAPAPAPAPAVQDDSVTIDGVWYPNWAAYDAAFAAQANAQPAQDYYGYDGSGYGNDW